MNFSDYTTMTPPLSPHNSEFQIMSSSLSSSPSSRSPHVQTITSLYQKTTQDFLLRNYDSAYSLCMTAISKLSKLSSEDPSTKVIQIKIWCLYISLIAALLAEKPPITTKKYEIKRLIERTPEKVCEEVYTTIVTKGYNNEDGEIPGEIILACLLLCLHQKSFKLARQIFEDWHDSLPELINNQLNHAAESAAVSSSSNPSSNGIKNDPILKNYERIVQLYILHVLPNLKEWEKANSFLNKNTIIDKERKQAYEQTLIRIKEKSNKSLLPKHQHHKEKVSNGHFGHHINGNGNGFFYHRMDYEHKQSLLSSSDNKNKKLGGIHNIPRQLINNRFFMSPTGSRTSIMGVRKMITNNIDDNNNNNDINNHNNSNNHHNNSHHTTITTSSETIMTAMLNRFRDTFCVYLQQASSNISIPKIIPFFIFIILLTSGWNKNFKSSLRGFVINGFVKFWETIKAGTTLTNV
ncbi:hypothetical protein Glove_152g36 [Diversispora epigaea]|uniref:Uncharacterized protein n=1 Tax=Diversispora epigaea TaxID=1348612 RepID=A0A397IVF2_9GLOM|nr:hypothetical protein Glove_152g36 [Diversispora epigaea]